MSLSALEIVPYVLGRSLGEACQAARFGGDKDMAYQHRFQFSKTQNSCLSGGLRFEDPENGYREALLSVEGKRDLALSLTHSEATEAFMYLSQLGSRMRMRGILDTLGVTLPSGVDCVLPGQFILGAERTRVVSQGVRDCMGSPAFQSLFETYGSGEIVAFPVLREGMKYGLAEAIGEAGNRLCDEIVVDAHHVEDASVPELGRRMELSAFKDKDLSEVEREAVKVAVIGDSVASGTVIVGLVDELARRFPNLERVELVAPLAAVYGLARIAAFSSSKAEVRIHCFETVLNALAPDFYYSPYFNQPEMHIVPEAYSAYRSWWGEDSQGRSVADTACAGFGWSEAFFNPGKQLRMIEEQLRARHGLSLAALLKS